MLLKNDNQRFIRTLSNNCLKANRIRNTVALLAILLTTVLFMAVATLIQGVQISTKEQYLRQSGTCAMASVKYITREKAEQILADSAWENAGMQRSLWRAGNAELANLNVAMSWMDESHAELSYIDLTEGQMPSKEYETACDTEVLRLLGIEPELGAEVPVQYITDSGVEEAVLTLCGIWEGEKYEQTSNILVSEAFLEARIDERTITDGASVPGCYSIRGTFTSDADIQDQLDELVKRAGFDPDAERGEAGFVIHNINPAYENNLTISGEVILAAAAGIVLILFAGYLIIYNIFRISILKDMRIYGQLKTIGASPRQIRYIVKRQGYLLSLAAILPGLVLGWLLGNGLLPLIMANTLTGTAVFVVPHPLLWIGSALFAFLTVSLSCSRPGRIAGRISPVEALRYQETAGGKKSTQKGGASRHRLFCMACANLNRSRGKTALVVTSLSLSILLLNTILNVTGCFDEETYIQREATADFVVRSVNYNNYSVDDYTKTLNPNLTKQLEEIKEIEDFGQVFIHLIPAEEYQLSDLSYMIGFSKINGVPTDMPGTITEENIGPSLTDSDWRHMVYGWDENMMNNMVLIEGELDYQKLNSGNYIIMAGILGDSGEYNSVMQEFHAGDSVTAVINGQEQEYEVLAVAGIPGTLQMDSSGGAYESMVLGLDQFRRLFPQDTDPLICAFNTREGSFDSVNEEVLSLAAQLNGSVINRLSAEQNFHEIQWTYNTVGLILALIFAVIGVLNLTNVLLTGAIARQSEFAVMRSIGMSRRQLRRLFIYEGVLYALLAGIVSILFSALISFTAVRSFLTVWWFAKYHLILAPALIAALVCIVLAAVISYGVDRVWNRGSIVDKLRRA